MRKREKDKLNKAISLSRYGSPQQIIAEILETVCLELRGIDSSRSGRLAVTTYEIINHTEVLNLWLCETDKELVYEAWATID